MSISFETYIQTGKEQVEAEMEAVFKGLDIPEDLAASMKYSLFIGGKRLRPVLMLASYESFAKGNREKVFKTAAALEMIHTYSLIHDDLPAMDDDDYRRGALTNHKKFDESTAILAGDALLTYSFEIIAADERLQADEKIYLMRALAKASGPEGMIAGQVLDIEGEKRQLSLEELEKVHEHKTGKLISFAVIAGAYLANATRNQLKHLTEYAHYLGLIFQVQDDILDIIGDEEKLGKAVGSDEEKDKSTYPNLLGLDGAKQKKEDYIAKAMEALQKANADDSQLVALLHHFSQRDH